MGTLLQNDDDMIERLECDLQQKVLEAYGRVPDLHANVHGVFSIDHLEAMQKEELCSHVGVGVGYFGGTTHKPPDQTGNPSRGVSAAMSVLSYLIILAVPTEEACGTRHNATKLLTVMRKAVHGSVVANDPVNRAWAFVGEKPEISASTKDVLYYSQVWQIAIPIVGNPP